MRNRTHNNEKKNEDDSSFAISEQSGEDGDDEESLDPEEPPTRSKASRTKRKTPPTPEIAVQSNEVKKKNQGLTTDTRSEEDKREEIKKKPRKRIKSRNIYENNDDRPIPTLAGGYSHTKQSKARIAAANKGNIPWNKGKKRSEEDRARISAGVKERNRKILLKKLEGMGMTEEEWFLQKKQKKLKSERERRQRVKAREAEEKRIRLEQQQKLEDEKKVQQEYQRLKKIEENERLRKIELERLKKLEENMKDKEEVILAKLGDACTKYDETNKRHEEIVTVERQKEKKNKDEEKKRKEEEKLKKQQAKMEEKQKLKQRKEEERRKDDTEKEKRAREEREIKRAKLTTDREIFWRSDLHDELTTYPKCPSNGPGGLICCQTCFASYNNFLTQTVLDYEKQAINLVAKQFVEVMDSVKEADYKLKDSLTV